MIRTYRNSNNSICHNTQSSHEVDYPIYLQIRHGSQTKRIDDIVISMYDNHVFQASKHV